MPAKNSTVVGHETQIRALRAQKMPLTKIASQLGLSSSAIRSFLARDYHVQSLAQQRAASLKQSGGVPRLVDDLELSVRSANCLDYLDIKTIDQLCEWTGKDLCRDCKNFGKKSFLEVQSQLAKYNIVWDYLYCGVCKVSLQKSFAEIINNQSLTPHRTRRNWTQGKDIILAPKIHFCSDEHFTVWKVMCT